MPTSESTAPVQSQIPQSSAPSYAYDTEVSYMDPQDYMLNQSCDEFNDHEESWIDESPKEDHSLVGGFMREMEGKGHMFNKFVAKAEKDVEALHEFRGCSVAEMVKNINANLDLEEERDDDVTIMERGLDDEFLASDGVMLERFRVKTVNIAGVVKDDQEQ